MEERSELRHHLDYDLQQSERAGPYYRRAYELDANNPVFVSLASKLGNAEIARRPS